MNADLKSVEGTGCGLFYGIVEAFFWIE